MNDERSNDDEIQLELTASPNANDIRLLGEGLTRSTARTVDVDATKVPVAVWMRQQGQILGGAHGDTHYGWLYLSLLWIDESLRGQGWGTRLVQRFEQEGITRGCHGAWVETYSFQAPDFYERLGYREFGRLEDFPPGAARLFYWKPL
jgi:GNAT superfamily N-acetyltransferase